MGLDQYARAFTDEAAGLWLSAREQDRALTVDEEARVEAGTITITTWRKHADLNAYMEALYYERNGDAEVFNCVPLELTADDLTELAAHIDEHKGYAQKGEGFFWGETTDEDVEQDMDFIKRAQALIAEGYRVFYYCWW